MIEVTTNHTKKKHSISIGKCAYSVCSAVSDIIYLTLYSIIYKKNCGITCLPPVSVHRAPCSCSTHKLHTLALFALLLQYWWVQTGGHCKPA